ncbi:MAG TPA: acyl-ACP--UDP-N-acetylglucosamine O-acyltransferase [Saprospiraceae bacterium]|jgi:UDP-N-acetylglucosamine acyltransferase|nr:acyl-ACP--UDP-N-acetylglucosamine O-acyltransferase [Saprospiraceae bacterium]MBK7698044.1 acyl-ACP--UDP-N-acetylglucosamine O-acyltransferase [Saprospiraceae bacterium]MBK8825285.1 acyl-ACP--UDP-N-acetylglucosamine O-acyltransferase [Saprospiraceae bacterium]MBK8888475.1 acyl-ACP--UDP-N-acetylglucosamine O-acyltransferase [Saprospiraceae bacterium]MBK9580792.1 acyl-ACP--UDP-N-acetylglucosamine O-acyltransferase [Saprospiraceae bacterium]
MISNLSFVHSTAKLGENVTVEPFAYIGENVEIGEGSWIGPHATVLEGSFVGKNCKIFPGAVVGAIPQDLKYKGEKSTLVIEDNVTVRECCTLNRGTEASMTTRIGKGTLLMAYVHVAHDSYVGSNCILANNVNLAGHIEIGNQVIIGGMSAVHQFVKIGDHVMIGGGSLVRKDVPPFVKAAREPLSYVGVNSIGLRRRGYTNEQINHIQDIYRILFVKGNNVKKAIEIIEATIKETNEKEIILQFLGQADRGLMKGFKQ